MDWTSIVSIITAYVLTIAGVGLWRRFALRRELLDVPNERSSHVVPTPSGGGVVIFFVSIAWLIFFAVQNGKIAEISPFLVGAVMIAGISWLDDLYDLPSLMRFAVHLVAAAIVVFGIGYFRRIELPYLESIEIVSPFGQLLTLLWIVGLTNAYNFMDGIDGIAGTQALIAGAGWCGIGFFYNQPLIFFLGGLLIAVSLGFLWHNWQPARIFMGDVGSAFIGFTLAVLPLFALRNGAAENKLAIIGVLLVWAFVFDTGLTFVLRLRRGENVLAAHRSHLYQRLVIAGFSHQKVTLVYGFSALAGAALSLFFVAAGTGFVNVISIILTVFCLSLWLLVKIIESLFAESSTK